MIVYYTEFKPHATVFLVEYPLSHSEKCQNKAVWWVANSIWHWFYTRIPTYNLCDIVSMQSHALTLWPKSEPVTLNRNISECIMHECLRTQ